MHPLTRAIKKTIENQMLKNGPSFFKKNLAIIATSNSVKGFGSGLVGTYVPLYFIELGGNPLFLGLITAITSLTGCIMFILGGFIADFYGRRKILVISAYYILFFPLLYAIVDNWHVFAVLSIIAAVGTVSIPAFHALVADSVPPERRTTGIASLQVISTLPVAAAPLIGGWMIQNHGLLFGFRLSCIFSGIAAFVSAFILLFFLKETSPNETPFRKKLSFAKLKEFPASVPAKLRALMLSHIFIAFANGAVGSYYILYASKIIGLKPLEWALIAGFQSLMTTLKIPGGWLGDRFGKRRIMIFSILTCAPCTILFTFSGSLLQTSIVMLLLAATGISYAPAYEALQADLTPRTIRGRITALWQLGSSLAIASGAFMGGFLFQTFNPSLPFYIFTVAELFAALLLIGFVREPREKEI